VRFGAVAPVKLKALSLNYLMMINLNRSLSKGLALLGPLHNMGSRLINNLVAFEAQPSSRRWTFNLVYHEFSITFEDTILIDALRKGLKELIRSYEPLRQACCCLHKITTVANT
jgi:hypothetical protein